MQGKLLILDVAHCSSGQMANFCYQSLWEISLIEERHDPIANRHGFRSSSSAREDIEDSDKSVQAL